MVTPVCKTGPSRRRGFDSLRSLLEIVVDFRERMIHLRASCVYGRDTACDGKTDYKSEETAVRVASELSIKFDKVMEGYPCFHCRGWHVGRALTLDERYSFDY